MVPPIKAIDSGRMRGNFSSHAEDYDSYASVQKRVVELLYGRLATVALQPGLCLDIGTGTGALASAMVDRVPGNNLVVMDIAHGMTRAAAERLPSVSACDGDARQLPFASEVFGCVVSSSVYQWVDCLHSAFTEVARVLWPGGYFALALFGEKTLCELRSSHCRAVEEIEQGRTSHVQNFPVLDEVADAIAAAGRGPGVFQLGSQQVVVDEHLATWSADRQNLVGSASTMPAVANHLRDELGLSDSEIRKLTFENPQRAIGLELT